QRDRDEAAEALSLRSRLHAARARTPEGRYRSGEDRVFAARALRHARRLGHGAHARRRGPGPRAPAVYAHPAAHVSPRQGHEGSGPVSQVGALVRPVQVALGGCLSRLSLVSITVRFGLDLAQNAATRSTSQKLARAPMAYGARRQSQ